VLAVLLTPSIAKTRAKAEGVLCLENTRQLTRAWLLYARDNEDRLVFNVHGGDASGGRMRSWVTGWLDWTPSSDNTNLHLLFDPQYADFSHYLPHDPALYKCPADSYLSAVQRAAGFQSRIRSYSMNMYLGGPIAGKHPGNSKNWYGQDCTVFEKLTDFQQLSPSKAFVFLDEHPDSINDPSFVVDVQMSRWVDLPASYHNGAGGLSFADGHSEIKKWSDSRTTPSIKRGKELDLDVPSPNNADVYWMQERSTRQQGGS